MTGLFKASAEDVMNQIAALPLSEPTDGFNEIIGNDFGPFRVIFVIFNGLRKSAWHLALLLSVLVAYGGGGSVLYGWGLLL